MGAGIVECDVTFTTNGDFVCRHADNDLAFTTNILRHYARFEMRQAVHSGSPGFQWKRDHPGERRMPHDRSHAGRIQEPDRQDGGVQSGCAYTRRSFWAARLPGAPTYTPGVARLMTLRESIELNEKNGVKHTPELKAADPASIARVFGSQEIYARDFARALDAAGVRPRDAFPQSFNVNDILYWIDNTGYGRQAVFLVDYDADKDNILLFDTTGKQIEDRGEQLKFFAELRKRKVQIIAPAMPALLAVSGSRSFRRSLRKILRRWGSTSSRGPSNEPTCARARPRQVSTMTSIRPARRSRKIAICTRRWTCSRAT